MQIRQYQSTDRDSVKALYLLGLDRFSTSEKDESYLIDTPDLDNVEETYLSQGGEYLVGLEGGRLMAMGAIKRISEESAELKRLSVHPEYRRNGYGQTIVLQLLERASQLGYSDVYLDTTAKNTPSRKLYEKLGFIKMRQETIGNIEVVFYHYQFPLKR